LKIHQGFRIEERFKKAIDEVRKNRRGVSEGDIINAALEEFFNPAADEKREADLVRHLHRIEMRLKSLERGNEILGEAFSLFVRAWLTNTLELPEDQKETAERSGGRRYKKFIEVLGQRLQSGKNLYDDLPEDVYFKSEAFKSLPDEKG